jgi:cytoskeletal protein CcmA (bactofilin family)
MALYTVTAGGTIQAADINQLGGVLTGTMTDQPVTLGNTLDVKGAITLEGTTTQTGALTANGGITASSEHVTGNLQVDGTATVAAAHVTGSATVDATLAATQVTSHGNPVVEGTAGATHVEAMFDGSSSGSLASNSYVTKTLACARAFPGNAVAVGASCQTSAGNKGAVGYGVSGYGYDGGGHINAITVAFQNLDANAQTLSGFSILVIGV